MIGTISGGYASVTSAEAVAAAGAQERDWLSVGGLTLSWAGIEAPGRTGAIRCLLDGRVDSGGPVSAQGISEAYARDGMAAITVLRGDFVVLVHDEDRDLGTIARDPLGGRALYWARRRGGLVFGSEIAVVLRLLAATPAPCADALARWLINRPQLDDDTLYDGIRRLPPGELLTFGSGGVGRRRWWSPRLSTNRLDRHEIVDGVHEHVLAAVRRRVPESAPVGVLLSGGLDSATVAALAAEAAPGRVRAYSALFPQHSSLDESALIRQVCEHLALPSTSSVAGGADGGMVHDAATWTARTRMPALGWGDFWEGPLWDAARADGVEALLTGDGGDELFGVRSALVADRLRARRPLAALDVARRFPGGGRRPPVRPWFGIVARHGVAPLLPPAPRRALERLLDGPPSPAWLRPEAARAAGMAGEHDWTREAGPYWWRSASVVLTRSIEALGVRDDIRLRGRIHGVQGVQPLFDVALVEWALSLPPEHLLGPGNTRLIVRDAMRGRLPEAVRVRVGKSRFDVVLAACLAGPDLPLVQQLIGDPAARLGLVCDLPGLRADLLAQRPEAHPNGRFTWILRTWRAVAAEVWLRSLEDPESLAATVAAASRGRVSLVAG